MTHIDTLLSRVTPLTESEAISLAAECEMLLKRALLCAKASCENTRFKAGDMLLLSDSIQAALDEMPSTENWEEEVAIARETGE